MLKGVAIFALLFLSFCPAELAAQQDASRHEISGQVKDKEGTPVPFAQIALYKPGEDAPLMGTVSEEDGSFVLEAPEGVYELAVVFVGYEEERLDRLRVRNKDKDLGTITLAPEATQLEEVVVEAEEIVQPVSAGLEGITINPEQTIANTGGTLLDVLRNTPSIRVGEDGGVSIRGSSGTNILIDGRNSALASDLEQIPASAIESINIVTNPNARYDAQAAGGVINIQLKKGEEMGTKGAAEVTLGNRLRLNTALRMNRRTTRYNIYGGYSFRRWPRRGSGTTFRETFDNNQLLEQYQNSERNDVEHTFNYGADYYFGRNILSYEGALNAETESDSENSRVRVRDLASDEIILQYFRQNTEGEENYTMDNALIYERTFDNPDREFRALLSHSFRDQLEDQDINVFNNQFQAAERAPDRQERAINDELRQTAILQTDYVHPFEEGKVEAGYKATIRSMDNDYRYEILDEGENRWINQQDISNRFMYDDQVHALYMIYSRSFGRLDVAAGSRLEQTFVKSRLQNTGEVNDQDYLNLFPSLQTLYKLNEEHALKFTYSRRIDRPNSWHLNPFPDVSDSLNVRRGNPNLQPEYIHSLEMGHMATWRAVDLTTNMFFRRVDGQLDYIVRIEDGISYWQPDNLLSSMTYGFEVINSSRIFPWWNLNASYSLFRTEVDGRNIGSEFTNAGISWYAKLTTDFTLPQDLLFQLTGNYEAPEIEAQGRDLARYYLDASLNRDFFDDKVSVSLTLRDVFNTRRFAGESFSNEFAQTFERKRESRIFLLNVRYSFGGND